MEVMYAVAGMCEKAREDVPGGRRSEAEITLTPRLTGSAEKRGRYMVVCVKSFVYCFIV